MASLQDSLSLSPAQIRLLQAQLLAGSSHDTTGDKLRLLMQGAANAPGDLARWGGQVAQGMKAEPGAYLDQQKAFLDGVDPATGKTVEQMSGNERADALAHYVMNNMTASVAPESALAAGVRIPRAAAVAEKPPLGLGAPMLPPNSGSLFDYSRLGEVPDVPQFNLDRVNPPRGPSARVQDLDTRKTVNRVNSVVDRGLQAGGADWYNNEPLRQAFVNELGDEAGNANFGRYMDMVAATSPRSRVPINVRNASYYYTKGLAGEDVTKPLPSPYGHIAQNLHIQNYNNVVKNGGWPVLQNPKPASFSQNLQGNQTPVTIDTHNVRLWGMNADDPRWLATQHPDDPTRRPQEMFMAGDLKRKDLTPTDYTSMPNPNEYGFLEQLQQREAAKKGISPAQYQAAAWVGGGDATGLGSTADPFLKVFENQVNATASTRGETPSETLGKFIRGEAPLLSTAPLPMGLGAPQPQPQQPQQPQQQPPLYDLSAGVVGAPASP